MTLRRLEGSLLSRGQQLHSRTAYPVDEVGDSQLRDGRRITVRPTRAVDAQGIRDLFFRLSAVANDRVKATPTVRRPRGFRPGARGPWPAARAG
jgi:hypothetical protein